MINQILFTKDGIVKKGTLVKLKPNYKGDKPIGSVKLGIIYSIKEIYSCYGDWIIVLDQLEDEILYLECFDLIPIVYNVYKWDNYYILSDSDKNAKIIWNTWADILKIKLEDDLLSYNSLKISPIPLDLYPSIVKGLKSESAYPCIKSIDNWDDNLFEYKTLIE